MKRHPCFPLKIKSALKRAFSSFAAAGGVFSGMGCQSTPPPDLEQSAELSENQVVISETLLRQLPSNFFGLSVNYLLDGGWAVPLEEMEETLDQLGTRIWRFPGGEKADAVFFATPPDFTKVQPTLISGSQWPAQDDTLIDQISGEFRYLPLDFDRFSALVRSRGDEAILVVPYDIMFASASDEDAPPDLELLLAHAKAWARHARESGISIRAWQIGNESFMEASYNGQARAVDYAAHLKLFAEAIRSEIPEARIAAIGPVTGTLPGDRDKAEGNLRPWWQTVLRESSHVIDYLAVHSYPVWRWGSFEAYGTAQFSLDRELPTLEYALQTWAPASDAKRIRLLLTETNSADWSYDLDGTGWDHGASFGHGLVLVDILARSAHHPKMDTALVWNTRWVNNQSAPQIWDAFRSNGELESTGLALSLASRFIRGELIQVSSGPEKMTAYASRCDDEILRILIFNRQPEPADFSLRLPASVRVGKVHRTIWKPGESGPNGDGVLIESVIHGLPKLLSTPGWSLTALELFSEP
jgi:alpha-N-arabinofuranosidase